MLSYPTASKPQRGNTKIMRTTTATACRSIALLICCALIATACGGGSSSDSSTTTTGEPSVADGGTPMAASSPIGAFFADGGGFESALAEYTIRVEEEIVVCMAAEGFEFARSTNDVPEIQELQNELTEREWTTRYGYGISTSFDSVAQQQASDPNGAIVLALTPAERDVWIETLTGGGFGGGGQDFTATPLEEQGCIGQALIETGGQEAIEGIETFGNAYEEGEEELFDRAEMVEVVDAWSRCMSEGGYTGFADLDDPEDDISDRFDDVIAPLQAAFEDISDEEGEALFAGESLDLENLPGLDLDALREIQKEEVEVALADLDCYDAEVKTVYEPLRDAFENGLLDTYATEFEALKNIGS